MAQKSGKVIIYSARDEKALAAADDRQYGYESKKLYKVIEKYYYYFPTRTKLNKSFE